MANIKLLQPQEIEVLYILPALRRELTIEMKKRGLEQKKIASLLGVTDAAVCQYVKSKRASKVVFPKKIMDEIKISSVNIKDVSSMIFETQRLLQLIKKTGCRCKIHKLVANISKECNCGCRD